MIPKFYIWATSRQLQRVLIDYFHLHLLFLWTLSRDRFERFHCNSGSGRDGRLKDDRVYFLIWLPRLISAPRALLSACGRDSPAFAKTQAFSPLASWACILSSFSRVQLFATPRTVATDRLPCAWDSPGKNVGVHYHALLQGNLPGPGIGRASLVSSVLTGRFFTTSTISEHPLWFNGTMWLTSGQ